MTVKTNTWPWCLPDLYRSCDISAAIASLPFADFLLIAETQNGHGEPLFRIYYNDLAGDPADGEPPERQ